MIWPRRSGWASYSTPKKSRPGDNSIKFFYTCNWVKKDGACWLEKNSSLIIYRETHQLFWSLISKMFLYFRNVHGHEDHVEGRTLGVVAGKIFRTQFHQHFTSSFYASRSQERKKLLDLTVFVALLGSACLKVACKMLIKLTPELIGER